MMITSKRGIFYAILAAALYAINAPFSKILLSYISPTLMAGLLYLGAGLSMLVIALVRKSKAHRNTEEKLTRKELPFTLAMILLDIAAPIFLLIGLSSTSAANASLLNNFEIVATAIIALAVFKEAIPMKLFIGIVLVTISCALLSIDDLSSFAFSKGSLFVLLASICWGIENNCTRKLSSKDPLEIVLIKGIFSGAGSMTIGLIIGEHIAYFWVIPAVLAIGCVAYGLSIFFYVYAQRELGAAKTSAFYAIAPFIGTFLSLIIFGEIPGVNYFIALAIMIVGAKLCA